MPDTWKPRLVFSALLSILAIIGCFEKEECCEEPQNPPEQCVVTDPDDQPDDDFTDTNCDGIDGIATTGLFVDPVTGSDTHPGTRELPVKSIKRALELVREDAGAGITALYLARGGYGGCGRRPDHAARRT